MVPPDAGARVGQGPGVRGHRVAPRRITRGILERSSWVMRNGFLIRSTLDGRLGRPFLE